MNFQSTLSISKHSIQVRRINLEPSQATASKHWSLHSVRVRVIGLGFGSGGACSPRSNKPGVRMKYPDMGVRHSTERRSHQNTNCFKEPNHRCLFHAANFAHERVKNTRTPGIDFCSCLLYTSPSPRDGLLSRMPSSA